MHYYKDLTLKKKSIFAYLAVPGLSCGIWDLSVAVTGV